MVDYDEQIKVAKAMMKWVDYDEQIKVAKAMMKWGGSFTRHLGEAIIRADLRNAQRVHDAFPECWEEYLEKSKKLEESK
ncbi:unnamed protein product [marine sediment metagenome]|uniref:Uncharacterized protein n=1 Tax=marine sediment metagenome TaxID=412755 RepID=X1QNK8_9ZZZZ